MSRIQPKDSLSFLTFFRIFTIIFFVILLLVLLGLKGAEIVVERVLVEANAAELDTQKIKASIDALHTAGQALLHGVLLDGIDVRVDIDSEEILVRLQFVLHVVREPVVVADDQLKLGAEDFGVCCLFDAFKSRTHDGNDHVEDDQHRDECSNEEDEPEDQDVIRVVDKAFSNLKVTKCQSV